MRFTTEAPGASEDFTIVLTGDGIWEKHVLASLASKLDGGHPLWWPELSAPDLRPEEKRPVGLGPLLRALGTVLRLHAEVLAGRRSLSFLLLIDKEHLPPNARLSGVLRKELPRRAAVKVRSVISLRPDAVLVRAEDEAGRSYAIYVVALGRERCLDEDLALLLKLRTGLDVEADKKAIRRALRETGIGHIRHLIAQASIKELEETFPELMSALRALGEREAK